ncbi:hypothetical protein F2P45_11435 [Massilia sp. CCM 8733]|uniref:Uncharacterized protein n=1 Tax=Massilia mucilaginosa TaxID=2609282 RepID=A0ABX0NS44_9BURK|nr:hypothetical protein [Massilia mucilaginosa]NHZ89620.1 hypothetical protein [Massilia mucilaginosa]
MPGLIEAQLSNLADIADRETDVLAGTFAGVDMVLARAILCCGNAEARPLILLMHPFVPNALAALDSFELEHTQTAKRILSFALLAQCTGVPRPEASDSAPLKPLLPARAELSAKQQRSVALLALAMHDTATARAFIDAEPATYAQPVLSLEFNLYELIRYLADALDQQRPADWIEPAWLEYLEEFPLHLASDAAEWPDLFYFARILANVRGDKVSDIADDLHARVQLLEKQG